MRAKGAYPMRPLAGTAILTALCLLITSLLAGCGTGVEEDVVGTWVGDSTGAELVIEDGGTYILTGLVGRYLEGTWSVAEEGDAVELEVGYRGYDGVWRFELEGEMLSVTVEELDIDETFFRME
jgi:hypothetical protein